MNRSTLLPLSCTLLSLAMVTSGFAASLAGTDVRPHHLLTGRVGMVTAGSAAGTQELGRSLTGISVTGQVSSESNTAPIQALRAEVVSRWDSSFRILVTVATFFVGLAGIAVPVLVWIFGRRLLDEFRQQARDASSEAKAAREAAKSAATEAKAAGEAVKRSSTAANKALEKVEQAAAATAKSKQDAAEALKVARSAVKDATANKAKLGEVEAKQKAHLEEIRASLKNTLGRLNESR